MSCDRKRSLEYLPIAAVRRNPRNPRSHPRSQIQLLAKCMGEFGFNVPVLVDRHLQLIAGHARLEAAESVGLEAIPVIRLEELSETQARAYMLADNRLGELSGWDEPALALHLKELSELALDFDLEVIGFETPEIDARIQMLDEPAENDAADSFKLAEDPISRVGDLWELGAEHRLYCGDALDPASYDILMRGDVATAVFADLPYNLTIPGNVSGLGRTKHANFAMASGEMTPAEFTQFLSDAMGATIRHTKKGGLIYACMDWRHLGEMHAMQKELSLDLLNLCVCVKTNGGMGSLYRSKHELVFVFRNGQDQHRNNVQLGRFGRNRSNVWSYAGANCFGKMAGENVLGLHPTVKPIALVADTFLDSTARDEIVLDPFVGSGTSILAAHRAKRRCRAIELNPVYVDTAIMRWEKMARGAARHPSGKTFFELREERKTGHDRV